MKTAGRRASRRNFLRGLGAGAAALPFVRLVERRAQPRRLASRRRRGSSASTILTASRPSSSRCGTARPRRASISAIRTARCSPSTIPSPTAEASRTRSSSSKASTSCRTRTLTTPRAPSSPAAASSAATAACPGTAPWINSWPSSSGSATATLVPSIALAVGSKQLSARETLSFGAGGVPISKIIDPGVAFDFLFKQAIVGDRSGGPGAGRARATTRQELDRFREGRRRAAAGARGPLRSPEARPASRRAPCAREETAGRLAPRRLRPSRTDRAPFRTSSATTAGSPTSTPSPISTSICSRSR